MISLSLSLLTVVALNTGPASAQDSPAGPSNPDAAPTSTSPPTAAPAPTESAPPAGEPENRQPQAQTPTSTVPTSVVELDIASIDTLLAEARVQARKVRDAQIAMANEHVKAAQELVGQALGRLGEATTSRDHAAAVVSAQEAEVETIRARIGAIAADAFMRVGTDKDEDVARLKMADGSADSAAVDAQQTAIYAGEAIGATRADLRVARDQLALDRAALAAAETTRAARQQELDAQTAVADAARATVKALQEAPLDVPAAATVSSLYGDVGPTILGRSLLTAEDLAAFARSRSAPHPSVDLDALARHFIEEGEAEGVRADLAWAQSIIETGNFGFAGSMVAPTDHNYAGIGACDTCSRGHIYETPQLGVRAQIQLLRTYADKTITAERLARPPAGRAPERVYVRGCCATWMALSGVWATGPGYGTKILTLYNEMLRFAVQRRLSGETGVTPDQLAAVTAPPTTVPLAAPTGVEGG